MCLFIRIEDLKVIKLINNLRKKGVNVSEYIESLLKS